MALAKASANSDVSLGSLSPEAIGLSISHYLGVKGFCTVDLGLDDAVLGSVQKDVGQIDDNGHLYEPSSIFLEGLLGSTGSARIAELELDGDTAQRRMPGVACGEFLSRLDTQMTKAVEMSYPYLGFELSSRTAAVLHEAGAAEGKKQVNDEEAAKWLGIFAHHRLMVIIFLGPSDGYLELYPFEEQESLVSKVPGKPGTMVILRPDLLAHTFSSSRGEAYCLSCFYTQVAARQSSKRFGWGDSENILSPCAAALDEWAMNRVRDVKENYDEDDPNRPRLPRQWELISNHTGFVGQHMAIRSVATRLPTTWNDEVFSSLGLSGLDFCTQVPIVRFDIEKIYEDSQDPDLWQRQKSNTRHGAFTEGIELFDNKVFRLSPAETGGMDPGHRGILETGYESLIKAGYTSKTLMNSKGGVFVAANAMSAEWAYAERPPSAGVCGAGNSVACGRVSFTFGMKGPCTSLDCGQASSLLALSECSTILTHRGKWEPPPFGVVATYQFQIAAVRWIQFSSTGVASPVGRCFTFDASASGLVRAETVSSCCVKPLVQMVDGEPVLNEAEIDKNLGTLASNAINQNGRRASMTTPDGAAEQEVMVLACRNAYISPLDVDAVEVNAYGSILTDAVEAASTARAYRPDGMIGLDDDSTSPLGVISMKTSTGDFYDSSGLINVIRIMHSHKMGVMMPTLHLRVINPHIDLNYCDRQAHISTEILEHRLPSAYTGVTARSFTGTNVHMLVYGQVDEQRIPPMPAQKTERESIMYWPEGGGQLEHDLIPRQGYTIAGSWSRFEGEAMQAEGDGVYGFNVVLGENRWEHFQIWLDGKKERALHPGEMKGMKNSKIYGPEEALLWNTWMLDGQTLTMYKTSGAAAITDGGYGGYSELVEVDTQDTGFVGDKYRVRLRVAGKFRTVEWEKLQEKAAPTEVPKGKYYVIVSPDLAFQEMACEDAEKGIFSVEVSLSEWGGDFLIVRDQDWMQVFHPAQPGSEEAAGPDPMQTSSGTWSLGGSPGDIFKITFQRSLDKTGKGVQQASWTRVGEDESRKEMLVVKQQPVFHLIGTWDGWATAHKMNWTGSHYEFFAELGDSETMSFRILKDGDARQSFYPSIADAYQTDKHSILGPGVPEASDMCWIIGKDEWNGRRDNASKGKRYEVRLKIEDGFPQRVEWSALRADARVEDAICRGFFAYGS